MGNFLKMIAHRIFEYPIKRPPICFYRQEDFTSSGVRINATKDASDEGPASSHREELKTKIKATTAEDQNLKTSLKKASKRYPGWDERTLLYLHNLFLLYEDRTKAGIRVEDFCVLLESLGEEGSNEFRSAKFQQADLNGDGWLTYDEFLPAIYNYNPPKYGQLIGVSKLCFEASENLKFVSNLTVGEQLEYGLF